MLPTRVWKTGTPALSAAVLDARVKPRAQFGKALPDRGVANAFQRFNAGDHGQGVAGKRARLVHGAQRGDHLHDLPLAAIGADGQAAADDLAQSRQIGRDAVERLRAAAMDAEAGHHLVEDEQRAVCGRHLAQPLQKTVGRRDQAHIAGHRLDDDGGDAVRKLRQTARARSRDRCSAR